MCEEPRNTKNSLSNILALVAEVLFYLQKRVCTVVGDEHFSSTRVRMMFCYVSKSSK